MSSILAIDPGPERSAWLNLEGTRPTVWGNVDNHELLEELRMGQMEAGWLLAIEMIASYGMAVGKEVFETCLWIGRFSEAWESRGGETMLIYRKDVKLYICESPKANDANIRAALIDRYGPGKDKAIGTKKNPGPLYGLKKDEWSALAIALTAASKL